MRTFISTYKRTSSFICIFSNTFEYFLANTKKSTYLCTAFEKEGIKPKTVW